MSGQLRECQAFAVVDKSNEIKFVDLWATNERDCWIGYADKWSTPNVEVFTTSHKEQGYTVQRVTVSSAGFEAGIEAAAKVCENGRFLHDEAADARFGKACADAIRRLSHGGIEAGEAERLLREARHWLAQVSDRVDMPDDLLDQIDAHLSARGGQ